MKYDFVLSVIFYIFGYFYAVFGSYIVVTNATSKINRLFLSLTSSMAIWSFAYSISNSAATAESSAFWRCTSVFGWGVFFSVLLHFILVLTKTESRLNKWVTLVLIYFPAVVNIILFAPFGFIGMKQYKMVRTVFGWVNTLPLDTGKVWLNFYTIGFSFLCLVFTLRWWKKLEPRTLLKRQATFLVLSLPLPILSGVITDVIPNILGKESFPKVTIISMIFPVVTLFLASRNYGLFLDRRGTSLVLRETDSLDSDRLRLFEMATGVIVAGTGLSFMVRYFGMKGALINEFLVAGALLVVGIFVKFIPIIVKKHSVQNTLFLAVSVSGMVFLTIINAETGATTIWALYILFLLVTVILDSVIHAYIFAVASIVIQVVFWIGNPKIPVTINGNDYIIRVFIIILSFVVIRYLTTEYASKIEGYQKFAKEQEALEIISSNYLSVSSENAKEITDKMLVLSAEILGFNHAYIIEFSEDYEDATVLNTCVNNVERGSFPYHTGMKVKTVTLPMAQPLITQGKPLTCEDFTNTGSDEAEERRNFFMSRGVHSFCALPILVDNRVMAMLVVEHYDRIDRNVRERQLYFLRIFTNILGDSKKKTLYEDKLYEFAYFDETTKLANRNMLKMRLDHKIRGSDGSGKIAVLVFELENLRVIKDTFGHNLGEQVMIKSATILKNLLDESCEIARTGEGDFVVVLPTVENNEQVLGCAERLLDSFSRPISTGVGKEALFVVPRLGVSMYPDDGKDADTLLKNADLAVYEAKNIKEEIIFYTERLESHIAENILYTNRLFESLQNEEFFLEYQPQINCDTGKTVGIEALLRWTSDGTTRVGPDRFIPILEQTGLIYDVGLWVLEQALREHNRLIANGFPPLRVSVNLSVVQFHEEDFILDLTKIIKESQVDPRYLELEITESLFSEKTAEILVKLNTLKEMGVRIAVDDFGKGYSSLNRLRLVPFDRIKIDKEITDNIDVDNKAVSITENIVSLAKAFNASITAEGVETKEKAEFLKSLGCDEIQGYYYSKPLSAEALEGFLEKA